MAGPATATPIGVDGPPFSALPRRAACRTRHHDGSDLAHHQHVALDGDDVDLAVTASPIALQHGKAVREQMIDSDLLTKLAEGTPRRRTNSHRIVGRHTHHLRQPPWRPPHRSQARAHDLCTGLAAWRNCGRVPTY